MATIRARKIVYPTSDGKPMAETDFHRILMVALIDMLDFWYASEPMVYVSGNLLIFYEPGNKRRHISPDVFVVKGVPKRRRLYYLMWEEGKGPSVVIELTSSSTRTEDTKRKFLRYQDILRVPEYFLFDPFGDYLKPQLQGYRLRRGKYAAIRPLQGRLPSQVLGLHLETSGQELRLFDPSAGRWLPTFGERLAQSQERLAEKAEQLAQAEQRATQAEANSARLQQEMDELRRRLSGEP